MKKVIIALVLLGLAGAGIGFYMYNKPADKMEGLSVDANVTAQELFTAYEADEEAANAKYLDKVIQVTGKVAGTKKDEEKATILLDTGDMLANIMCQMESMDDALPNEGESITIKGLCTGYLTDVVLIKAIMVKN